MMLRDMRVGVTTAPGGAVDHTGNIGASPPKKPPQRPLLPPAPRKEDSLVLQVKGRMLWVRSAAIPLRNITWVDAYKSKPDWSAAGNRFLWLIGGILVYAAINYASGGGTRTGEDGNLLSVIVVVALVGVLIGLLRSAKPVLVVEMTSGSRVMVTLPNMDELQQIAEQIVHAIDNPEAEFTAIVRQFNKTNNYGPVVTMNGGRGNTGVKL